MELYREADLECINAFVGSNDRPATQEDEDDIRLRLAEWMPEGRGVWVVPVRSNPVHLRQNGEVSPLVRAIFDDEEFTTEAIARFAASCLDMFGSDSDAGRLFIRLGEDEWLCTEEDVQRYVRAIEGVKGLPHITTEFSARPARVLVSHHCLSLCVERLKDE